MTKSENSELSELGKWAVAYAEAGIAVIPLLPRSKRPAIDGGLRNATANVEQVREYWERHPEHNVAIVTGEVSDGLFAVDVDVHGEVDGWDTLAAFEDGRPLPEAPMSITGTGGGHLLYRSAETVRNGVGKGSMAGIDVRGDGGYIVAPPSVHPETGRAYRWEKSPVDVPVPEADENVLELVRAVCSPGSSRREPLSMPDEIREGEGRDNYLFKMAASARANNYPRSVALSMCLEYNRACCKPPLAESVVRKKVESAYRYEPGLSDEAKASKEAKARKADGAGGKPRRFDHTAMAKRLIEEHGACLIDGMTPAIRNGGAGYSVGWKEFDRIMIGIDDKSTKRQRSEVKSTIEGLAPARKQSDWHLVAFQNGVLDIRTLELRPWAKDDVICNVIPHRWNPDARSETLIETFRRMAAGDDGVFANLSEVIGICMCRSSVQMPYLPVLIGSGANGKSTYMKLITDVLGRENVSALQPREMGARFMASHMNGKLANVSDDIANGYIGGDECAAIKKMVTGDTIFTDVKGADGFHFRPYATIVIACNAFPRVGDTSDGFMRRLFAIGFNAKFTRDDPDYDPEIGDKLASEETLEAACVIGVFGLRSVIANRGLTQNGSNDMVKYEIEEESNTALQWIRDDDIKAEDLEGKTKAEMYSMYEGWCYRNGYSRTMQSAYSVSKLCKKELGAVLTGFTYVNGKRTRIYQIER